MNTRPFKCGYQLQEYEIRRTFDSSTLTYKSDILLIQKILKIISSLNSNLFNQIKWIEFYIVYKLILYIMEIKKHWRIWNRKQVVFIRKWSTSLKSIPYELLCFWIKGFEVLQEISIRNYCTSGNTFLYYRHA